MPLTSGEGHSVLAHRVEGPTPLTTANKERIRRRSVVSPSRTDGGG